MAQRSVRPTVRWATAAAILTLLPPSTAASRGMLEASQLATESHTLARAAPTDLDGQTSLAEYRKDSSLGARVLFVAGPGNVRFRIDLRDGTLSTPSTPNLVEGVIDVVVAERLLILCRAESSVGSTLKIVGFDLETGVRIRDVGSQARAASTDATFCTPASPPQSSPRSFSSPRLQNI